MSVRLQPGSPQPTSVGYSSSVRPGSCAPRRHRSDLPQVANCGAVASELPTPATSCKHTGQIYLDLLRVFRCRRLAAAEMLTDLVRSSAYTRTAHSTWKVSVTNYTSREQHAGDFDVSRFTPRVYEAAAKTIATQPVKSDPQPTHATEMALSTWKICWTDFAPR